MAALSRLFDSAHKIAEHGQKMLIDLSTCTSGWSAVVYRRAACSSCYASLIYALHEGCTGCPPASFAIGLGSGKGAADCLLLPPMPDSQYRQLHSDSLPIHVRCPPSAKGSAQLDDWLN